MTNGPNNRTWDMKWYHFSDCACAWKGEAENEDGVQGSFKFLWDALFLEPARLAERLENDDNGSSQFSLIGTIRRLVRHNHKHFTFDWDSWDQNIDVAVRVWPKDKDFPKTPPDAVIGTNTLYLLLSDRIAGPNYTIDIKHDDTDRSSVSIKSENRNITVNSRIEFLQEKRYLNLDPFMKVIDNDLLNKNDEFRNELRRIGRGRTKDPSEEIKNALANHAPGDFLDDYSFVSRYDVDLSWGIEKSTFSWDGSELSLKLGFKRRKNGQPDDGVDPASPDYPCGNYEPEQETTYNAENSTS